MATIEQPEALVLSLARGPIAGCFTRGESHGAGDESRRRKPWHALCDGSAKGVVIVVHHGVFLTSCWAHPDRRTTAANTRSHYTVGLSRDVWVRQRLENAVTPLARPLRAGCRMPRRRAHLRTAQELLAFRPQWFDGVIDYPIKPLFRITMGRRRRGQALSVRHLSLVVPLDMA